MAEAQLQTCVQADLMICSPPVTAINVASFGVPLPEGFITAADYGLTLTLQFKVSMIDTSTNNLVTTILTMAIQLSSVFTMNCETATASQNLADIISGNVYIGTAQNDNEWTTLVQKKVNIDVPGTTPSNSFDFSTTTVQGSVMTFAALGSPSYFEDQRALTQTVHIDDLHTVPRLECTFGLVRCCVQLDLCLVLSYD